MHFKPFVEKQLVKGKKIYRLTHLSNVFNRLIKEHDYPNAEFA